MDGASAESDRRKQIFWRFLVSHTVAYIPAFVAAAAWVPVIVWTNFDTLMSAEVDEKKLASYMLHKMIAPALAAFAVPHLLGIRWMLARDNSGRGLLFWGTAAFTLLTTIAGVVLWIRMLKG